MINIRNNDNKSLSLVSYQIFKSIKIPPWKNNKVNKKIVNDLDYKDIIYAVFNKDFSKIEKKNYISINVLCYENGLAYPAHIPNKKLLKIVWIYYWLVMKISHIMSTSKTLTDFKRL